jgi:hypothetical protein
VQLSIPDALDASVVGFSVTFWTDPDNRWLLQYATRGAQPCFALIGGVRTKIQPAFEADRLYRLCADCLVSNPAPEAGATEYPSLNIGFAFATFRVFAIVPLDERATPQARALRDYLVSVL